MSESVENDASTLIGWREFKLGLRVEAAVTGRILMRSIAK